MASRTTRMARFSPTPIPYDYLRKLVDVWYNDLIWTYSSCASCRLGNGAWMGMAALLVVLHGDFCQKYLGKGGNRDMYSLDNLVVDLNKPSTLTYKALNK